MLVRVECRTEAGMIVHCVVATCALIFTVSPVSPTPLVLCLIASLTSYSISRGHMQLAYYATVPFSQRPISSQDSSRTDKVAVWEAMKVSEARGQAVVHARRGRSKTMAVGHTRAG